MPAVLRQFWCDDTGATAIEYAMIATLISIGIIAGASLIGTNLKGIFSTANTGMTK